MKIEIEPKYFKELLSEFDSLRYLDEQLKFGGKIYLPVLQLGADHLHYLAELYNVEGDRRLQSRSAQFISLKSIFDTELIRFQEGQLETVLPTLAGYLMQGVTKGWLFKVNAEGKPFPFLVNRLDFTPPGEEENGRVIIELKANSMGKVVTHSLIILERDILGKTIGEVLLAKGYVKESDLLLEAYNRSQARYFDFRSSYGKQFEGIGTGIYTDDPLATHRGQDWSRKKAVILSSSGDWARLVNDEEILQTRELSEPGTGQVLAKYLRKAGKSARYDERVEAKLEQLSDSCSDDLFKEVPVHGYMLMFHLELHHHIWVHVDDLREYVYRPDLKDKLVLPQEQIDLIDILTSEMELLDDDIVAGKSGGTTVLCAGPPGVGKTLTAEVYSEIIRKPLYRVHSGQLGLNVMEMEKELKDTLMRAQRWGAVMLIDEADVYIKRRDDNISANAVVGIFLRVLEYFNGLLFLTTNRIHDIDEAIVSRCIALIKYSPPDEDDRRRLWRVMAEQFGLKIDQNMVDQLAKIFPEACGRDIKGLTKLVARFCAFKSMPVSIQVFEHCSVFRGMDMVH